MSNVMIEKHPQAGYELRAECFIARPIDEVFEFFSDAANLQRLTPPWLNFRILTPAPIELRLGLVMDYKLRVRGVPVRWQSEITVWDPPHEFADEARRGPYRFWRHTHRFEPRDGGTRVIDELHYGVPGGALVNWLFVGRDLRKIFTFRHQVLAKVFPARPLLAGVVH